MTAFHITSSNKEKEYRHEIANFYKPCSIPYLCCCRPKLIVYYPDGNNTEYNKYKIKSFDSDSKKMGFMVDQFAIGCKIIIFGEDGIPKYKIYGNYLQMGFACRIANLGKCYEVDFWIYEINAKTGEAGEKAIGNIHKVFKGLSDQISDSDVYIITFPEKATGLERFLIIGGCIHLDYIYYEQIAFCDFGNLC